MRPHRKLDVWKEAVEFVVAIYQATRSFPKTEQYALADQLRRAAVSIPSNIAEGAARQTKKEFIQFLFIAKGSAAEVQSQLYTALDLKYVARESFDSIYTQMDVVSKQISRFITYLKSAD